MIVLAFTLAPAIIAIAVPTMTIASAAAMFFLVMRDVSVVVPVFLDEIDALAAGTVLVAILIPMLGMAGRDVHVDGRPVGRHMSDEDRLGIDHMGMMGKVADVDAAVESRLTHGDGYAHVCGQGGHGGKTKNPENVAFHFDLLGDDPFGIAYGRAGEIILT